MATTYLAVPLKRTWEVDYVKPLKTFIANTFSGSNPEEYGPALSEFNKLRTQMVSKSGDKHESALEVLYRYYDQINANESKFPIAENSIRINFRWQDAFDKESFFSGKRTLAIASSNYERACVLFNTAALQSQIAGAQNSSTDEGLKASAKLYQQAAGTFTHLRDFLTTHYRQDMTPDMNPDTLNGLISLMLAQGQDCFCRKAMNDKMKPATVAKVLNQCSEFYAEALKNLQISSIRDLWPRDWISSVAGKQAGYHGLAEYYQSMVAKEAKDFGTEISRLRHAKDLMIGAETRGGTTFIFNKQSQLIRKALEDANKDNDLIYHAKVPDQNALPTIGKAVISKVIALPSDGPLSQNFKDLFEKVVPLAVHQALCAFDARKAEMANQEINRLREKTNLLNTVLASLNLPAAIEDLSGATVPSSVLDKAKKVRDEGGINFLNQLMNELPALLTRNKEIHDESMKMLDEEESSDKQLRAQFKERWTRTPSEKLTTPLRSEGKKYTDILTNAINADGVVKQRYSANANGIALLSKNDVDIQKVLPQASPAAALKNSPAVLRLRQLMEEIDAIKAEREVTETQLKDVNIDMSSRFMGALAADGAVTEEDLSLTELNRVYEPLRSQVTDSCNRQDTILQQVQEANDVFTRERSQNQSGVSREEKLKEIATAYDSFIELKKNLQEGTKFYNDLTPMLVKYQSKVQDFCFARKTEKDDLMKDLQTAIANRPAAPAPTQPTYQQPTEEPPSQPKEQGSRVPPARPPPPTRPAGSAPTAPPPATTAAPTAQPTPPPAAAAPSATPMPQVPQPYAQPPYPGYGAMPYPIQPGGVYAAPVMPMGYNPYAQYGYPPQQQQQYPGYPGYPSQGNFR